jgi:hypothetical protein
VHIQNQKDFFAGVMFIGLGVTFAWSARVYDIGSASQMGPGYFPMLLGILMALIGAVLTFRAVVIRTEGGAKIGGWAWRPMVYIIAANLVFGVLLAGLRGIKLPALGLILAIYAMTFIVSMARANWKFTKTLALATVLAAGSYLIFVLALKLQIQVWPWFIQG